MMNEVNLLDLQHFTDSISFQCAGKIVNPCFINDTNCVEKMSHHRTCNAISSKG